MFWIFSVMKHTQPRRGNETATTRRFGSTSGSTTPAWFCSHPPSSSLILPHGCCSFSLINSLELNHRSCISEIRPTTSDWSIRRVARLGSLICSVWFNPVWILYVWVGQICVLLWLLTLCQGEKDIVVSKMTDGDDPTSCEQLAVVLLQVSSEKPFYPTITSLNVLSCP